MKREEFKRPAKKYRGVPFWSWNDDLEDAELIRQIGEMDEGGWGGFFMHSRIGLVTPYLSQEWMDRIKTCVEEARKRGMFAWLYDEDKWPSGYAGGIVPKQGPNYRLKVLACRENQKLEGTKLVQVFSGDLREGVMSNLRVVDAGAWPSPRPADVILYFSSWIAPLGNPWFNGYAYVDNLNPRVVNAFIESTYEAYEKQVGEEFGKAVPGIFTDEPCFLFFHGAPMPCIPWTNEFPQYFEKKKGYDILYHLPSLFYKVGNYHKIRYDFWSAISDLFLESYSQRIYRWCDEHKLRYTGHYMAEDNLLSQIHWIGSAMPHYEYMHTPGMDHLGRNIHNIMTAKQVTSVAEQLGKERALTEAYGCSGQNLSFEGRKWIGDWHYVLGINLLNHHLALYSMRGCRKRDFPPNLYYQQPWWKYNDLVEDYFARLSYALTRGKRIKDILIIHSLGSAWVSYQPDDFGEVDRISRSFADLSENLLRLHRDYDYGDEKLLEKYGRVEDGKIEMGECSYKVVIIPPSVTLRNSTVRLLNWFADKGGKIIAINPLPYLVEGEKSSDLERLLSRVKVIGEDKGELKSVLDKSLPAEVEIADEDGREIEEIWYHHRVTEDKDIYFLANLDRDSHFKVTAKLKGEGNLEEWDPATGKIWATPGRSQAGYTKVALYFPPVGSHLLVLNRGKAEAEQSLSPRGELTYEIELSGDWNYERESPNSLTLDYCSYRTNDTEWSEKLPVLRAFEEVKEMTAGITFSLRYEFKSDIEFDSERDIFLVLETPERFEIMINGKVVKYKDIGYWRDISFKKIDIKGYVQRGDNTIEISGEFKDDTELESCYVIGDFGVENIEDRSFKLVEERRILNYGDLVDQGYPFFAGTIALKQEIGLDKLPEGRVFLELEGLNTIVADIFVNGSCAGQIYWRPHRIEVTELIKEGRNKIEIKLVNSLHNLLGPHHHKGGELLSVSPFSFVDWDNWKDEYTLVPYGLEKAKLVVY